MLNAEKTYVDKAFASLGMLRATFTPNFLSFLMMRITGVALAAFLFLHLWTIGQVHRGTARFDAAMAAYDNPLGWILEYLLLLGVLFHLMNGLRLIAADFLGLTERQAGMLMIAVSAVAVVGALSITVFFPGLLSGIMAIR